MGLSSRQRKQQSVIRLGQDGFTTVFEATGFDDLNPEISEVDLRPGQPFRIELTLRLPVAAAFNLAGAEAIFRPAMPPGLVLNDVHADGQSVVVIETTVVDVAAASTAGAAMGIWPVLLPIALRILASWKFLSLVSIGLFFGLGFLVSAIRGKTPFAGIGETFNFGSKAILVLSVAIIGASLLGRTKRSA